MGAWNDIELHNFMFYVFLQVGCVCSNVQVKEGGAVFGHPVDTALFMLAEKVRVVSHDSQLSVT